MRHLVQQALMQGDDVYKKAVLESLNTLEKHGFLHQIDVAAKEEFLATTLATDSSSEEGKKNLEYSVMLLRVRNETLNALRVGQILEDIGE